MWLWYSILVTTNFGSSKWPRIFLTIVISRKTVTLYNTILRIARNFLETRENIKISTHPFYHINLRWFSWVWSKKKNFFFRKKNSKWPTQKKLIFQNHQFSKFFSWKFFRFVLGLVGLNDAKGIDVAQRIWPWACPTKAQKQPKNTKKAFFACFTVVHEGMKCQNQSLWKAIILWCFNLNWLFWTSKHNILLSGMGMKWIYDI